MEQPLKGGSAQQLTSFKTGQIHHSVGRATESALLLTRGQTTRDVFLIEIWTGNWGEAAIQHARPVDVGFSVLLFHSTREKVGLT